MFVKVARFAVVAAAALSLPGTEAFTSPACLARLSVNSPALSLRSGAAPRSVVAGGVRDAKATLSTLLFDCDGVLADTERDGHRVAFNMAFKEAGLKVGEQDMEWGEDLYGRLCEIGGGKVGLYSHPQFATPWPSTATCGSARKSPRLCRKRTLAQSSYERNKPWNLEPGLPPNFLPRNSTTSSGTPKQERLIGYLDTIGYHGDWDLAANLHKP